MRRLIFALMGLVAGLLAVAAPGSVVGAQNQIAPVAVAAIGDRAVDQITGVATVKLDGTGSFDPDGPGGGIVGYRWEVVTEAYQWLEIDDHDAATASFKVPSEVLAARYGPSIEFRLTVTDSGSPAATASAVVVFSINRGPVVDIAVSAMLPAPRGQQFDHFDDNGNGVVDENSERYTRYGVILGPGDNGNADNEWDIREGSLLVLDGSGSSDAGGPLPASAFSWKRLYASDVPAVTDSLPGNASGQKVLSTDEDPDVAGSVSSETIARLSPSVGGDVADPYYLYYQLTVTDEDGVSASKAVKIVIHDAHDDPEVEIGHPESGPRASGTVARRKGVLPAGKNRYVISTEAAQAGLTLTAIGTGDGSARTRNLVHTWFGTGVEPSESNRPGSRTTAVFTAPDGAGEGDSFIVEVKVVDPAGHYGSTTVELVVADTRVPTATAPPDIDTPDGTDGGYPVVDPPTGVVTLRGFGFDPDDDPLAFKWEQVRNSSGDPLTVAYRGHRVALNGSATDTAWFALPEVTLGGQYAVYVEFTVADQWGVSDSDVVKITIRDGDDDIKAIPGPPQQVQPGSFVRLRGNFSSGLVSADALKSVIFSWAYTGIETRPRTERRPPITDDEIALGFVAGQWFPDDDGTYAPDAGGRVKSIDGRYPYFDAPQLGGFNIVKLTFELTVNTGTGSDPDTDAGTVVITVTSGFFSGVIDGPDFCTNLSLGGPLTYPLDSDRDGVADTCSLRDTRRAAVARQNALKTLATLNPDAFEVALLGELDDPDTTDVDESTKGTCGTAPKGLGDAADDLAQDACGRAARDGDSGRSVSPLPPPVYPTLAGRFFSGVIDAPSFCANRSLGGPATYAHDSDSDGVADVCALPYTRREAVARQYALEAAFADHPPIQSRPRHRLHRPRHPRLRRRSRRPRHRRLQPTPH